MSDVLSSTEIHTNKKKFNSIYIMKKMIPKIFKTCPIIFSLKIIVEIFHGLSYAIITLLLQNFFDNAALLTTKQITFLSVIMSLIVLCLGYIISQVLNGVGNYIPKIIYEKVKGNLSVEIHEKISKIPPIYFEETEKLDFINKADEGKNNSVMFVEQFLGIFVFYLPYFIFMSWYLVHLKPILIATLFFVFIPTFISQLIKTNVFTDVEDKSASYRRKVDYYEECMVSQEYYKETRQLGAYGYFNNLYKESLIMLQKIKLKATFKTGIMELKVNFLTVFGYIGILFLLFVSLMHEEITVTQFSAVFASLTILYGMMDELITEQVAGMSKNYGSIINYLKFLKLEENHGEDVSFDKKCDIILGNVSFSYPQSQNDSIKNVSIKIKAGEIIAIVGENGSGKSTLIRLITGIYKPTRGNVIYGDKNISNVSYKSLFKNVSAVFQKFQRYKMTLKENLIISDNMLTPLESELDSLCKMTGVENDKSTYPNSYDTMLSREFDGVDLSGGQWQRIAIARGLYRSHDIIILDEPTSAIDPNEETRIYNEFAKISKDKTSIIVTHRLGSVKLADRILVMKDGAIVQIGTHNELIKKDGEYRNLYKSQEQWYKDDDLKAY